MRLMHFLLLGLWGMFVFIGSFQAQDVGMAARTALAREVMLISASAPVFWSPDSHFFAVAAEKFRSHPGCLTPLEMRRGESFDSPLQPPRFPEYQTGKLFNFDGRAFSF